LVVTALGMFLATQALAAGAQAFSPLYSQRPLAVQIAAYVTPDTPFYSLDDYPQSLPFYLGRTLIIAHYKGELEFGIGQEPARWIPDRDAFASQWRADKAALAVMPLDTYAEMQKEGLPMTEIGRDPQRVVVRKP
ncbi:MAG TPA: 4-amino-4-deoxy-L-arabinose transferase, partial [Gammaproteobacteria bacterium]|nr:4-amino-4-deoxy-L-arabinose transferase [Gammaproteobacteria bacterium]